ncbi:adenylate/guanylate cyclase domain-containing protein [Rhabdaerophilum calidifontis]|uniref:adenylate/guanylate cyclase domain-containing protein n=1 Tax=Rhabdaerophilum calidifontis TaxID=2604328 RepID=UPI001981BFB1|nr:adenylate/guanylate cyclase domain-containing protein [Rhabdaerophilum calidifontis]
MKRKITAILAADIAEYTRLIAEDEEETLARLEAWRQVFDDFIHKAGGRIFNTAGDGVMCEFASAVEATRAAIDIQESLRTRNLAYPSSRQMHFRIGISIGDVVERDGDLLGDGVNVAARLQAMAEPGGICVSRNVQEAVQNKISVPFRDLGEREVKNLPHPVHAYRVEINPRARIAQLAAPHPRTEAGRGLPLRWVAAALVLAASAAGGALLVSRTSPPPREAADQAGSGRDAAGRTEASRIEATRPPATGQTAPPRQQASIIVTEALSPAQAFEKLAKSGGLVKDPASAPELYHNARSFEARGESAAARRDYLALMRLGGEQIDPVLRFAALLRAQDGRAGARELLGEIAQGGGRAVALGQILQFEGAERQSRLVAFAEANPDYAPVHALLAREFGEARQNGQTIDERRRELAALRRFLAAEREGRLVPFFLDQSVLAGWLDEARRREAAAAGFFAANRDRIDAQFMRSNAGWLVSVIVPEAAGRIEYRLGDGRFRATGTLQVADPRTGRPMANPTFELPDAQNPAEIAIRYQDQNGVDSAVTTISFDPRAVLIRGQRDILERFTQSWLAFGQGHNAGFLYFTHLLSYRCAIEKAEIGFNGAAPAERLPMPPCDEANPHAIPANALPYLRLKPEIESATIRITFVGGEVSETKTFLRPK